MKDKVLIYIYVPLIGEKYNVFIPVNKKVGTIKKYIEKAIVELSEGNLILSDAFMLRNKISNAIYDLNDYIKDTDIRNGSKLILL